MRAENGLRIDVERILIVARGVRLRDVQRLEVIVYAFNFRAGFNGVAEAQENIFNLALHARDGMERTDGALGPGQGRVGRKSVG